MPTHQDETVLQRYAREHQAYLAQCGSLNSEQVAELQMQLHNALAREVALQAKLDRLEASYETVHQALGKVVAQRDAILLQARIWSGEAKAQRGTVNDVGSILGGMPDWGPIAAKVGDLVDRLNTSDQRNDDAADLMRRALVAIEGDGWTGLEHDIAIYLKGGDQ